MVVGEKSDSEETVFNESYIIKTKTHDDLEIEIQTERVLSVIDETITKIKIAALLGLLTHNNGEILSKYLQQEQVNYIVGACELYLDSLPMESENRSMVSTTDTVSTKLQERSMLMKEKYDVHLMKSIDIIFANPNLVSFLETWNIELDQLSMTLLQGMVQLKIAAKDKLSKSALDEKEKEKILKNAYKDNIEAKSLIAGLQERLNKQTDELSTQLDVKENLIRMYTEKIEDTKIKLAEDIKKRVSTSEKEMIKHSKLSEEREMNLAEEAKESTLSYNKTLDQHLAAEKLLRAKRLKVESQLGNWLEKYDKEIGDRQADLEKLQGEYDVEKAEMDALQAKLDEQEEEYLELMAEKKEYDEDVFNKKYYAFIINRSARIIQRCWKAYKERKKARKLAKKSKKKAKVEAPPPEPEPEPEVDMFGDDDDDEPPPPAPEEPQEDTEGKKKKGGKKGKKKAGKSESAIEAVGEAAD
nr:IQ domain-containing protein D [Onthophagus taurus]